MKKKNWVDTAVENKSGSRGTSLLQVELPESESLVQKACHFFSVGVGGWG